MSAASARRPSTSPMSRGGPLRRPLGAGLQTWDMAAGIVLVREAGGFVSDLHGGAGSARAGDISPATKPWSAAWVGPRVPAWKLRQSSKILKSRHCRPVAADAIWPRHKRRAGEENGEMASDENAARLSNRESSIRMVLFLALAGFVALILNREIVRAFIWPIPA